MNGSHDLPRSSGAADAITDRVKRHKEEIRRKKFARARGILCQAIIKKVGAKPAVGIMRAIALGMLECAGRSEAEIIGWLLGESKALTLKDLERAIEKSDDAGRLWKILAALHCSDSYLSSWTDGKRELFELQALAKTILGARESTKILAAAEKALDDAESCRHCGCTEQIPCDLQGKPCSWKRPGVCSNPDCVALDDRKAKK